MPVARSLTAAPAAAIDRTVTRRPRALAMCRVAITPATRSITALAHPITFECIAEAWNFPNSEPPTRAATATMLAIVPITQSRSRLVVIFLVGPSSPFVQGTDKDQPEGGWRWKIRPKMESGEEFR